MYVKVAKREVLKRSHHKKIMCSCEWWWMVTELLVIISQHVHIYWVPKTNTVLSQLYLITCVSVIRGESLNDLWLKQTPGPSKPNRAL